MSPHAKTWRDLDTPLGKMGQRAAVHPLTTFEYTPAIKSDIRVTFARVRKELAKAQVRAA